MKARNSTEITEQMPVGMESAASAPTGKQKKKGDLMYLGPTLTGVARHGTVFKDGKLPPKAQECIAELPVMERLFVELDKAPDTVRELRKSQSALGTVYTQVEQKFIRRT